ncbi:methyltransferase TYW3 domain-containing protein [Neurospora intermedia]|uniref:tRNA(Phe) 7-[(3-amino-3-carboxypropyl)-4-demethylwyosine(37)-N(4)]-methyltransferase n=1 Tax=Neurospora intermedia TaxID=5142 RepID=A0ABR3D7I6_NEUIN
MLPPPTPSFLTRKSKILSQLSVPDVEYTDASPKGSVDVAIRDLIDEINHGYEGLVTTSSCAGRVSVYLEGVKRKKDNKASGAGGVEEGEGDGEGGGEDGVRASTVATTAAVTASSSGGKGGGEWLFVSHDPLETVDAKTGREYDGDHWMEVFGLIGNGSESEPGSGAGDGDGDSQQEQQQRLIHFKFEPMILHILTTSPYHAHLAIQSSMTSGFRETGAVSILPRLTAPFFSSCHQCHTHHNHLPQQLSSPSSTTTTPTPTESVTPNPIVAIRSMGLSFESLIGVQRGSQRQSLVSPEYLSLLVKIANERFVENKKRIARFKEALRLAFGEGATAAGGIEGQQKKKKKKSSDGESGNAEWEDAEARKQRKREEGLARREEVRRRKEKEEEEEEKRRKQEEIKEEENAGKVDLAEVVLQVPDVL